MNNDSVAVKPKRGRRSKKEIEAAKAAAKAIANANTESKVAQNEELQCVITKTDEILHASPYNKAEDEVTTNIKMSDSLVSGSGSGSINSNYDASEENIKVESATSVAADTADALELEEEPTAVKQTAKKRGRKPKGGKIIVQMAAPVFQEEKKPNIILHLKCSLKDLNSCGDHNSNFTTANIDPYNFEKNDLKYEIIDNNFYNNTINQIYTIDNQPNQTNHSSQMSTSNQNYDDNYNEEINTTNDNREIWRKLKILNTICISIIFLIKNRHVFGVLVISIIHRFIFRSTL